MASMTRRGLLGCLCCGAAAAACLGGFSAGPAFAADSPKTSLTPTQALTVDFRSQAWAGPP